MPRFFQRTIHDRRASAFWLAFGFCGLLLAGCSQPSGRASAAPTRAIENTSTTDVQASVNNIEGANVVAIRQSFFYLHLDWGRDPSFPDSRPRHPQPAQ